MTAPLAKAHETFNLLEKVAHRITRSDNVSKRDVVSVDRLEPHQAIIDFCLLRFELLLCIF